MFDRLAAIAMQSMWSPASGPVQWTPEKIEAAQNQARALTRAILTALRELSAEDNPAIPNTMYLAISTRAAIREAIDSILNEAPE